MSSNLKIGDEVICIDKRYFGVSGEIIKQYYPTACEQQTMIECRNGRIFHAPTRFFRRIKDNDETE